jgi:2',3'-cyclic-nucleotide 2'-phosphodiesterase
MKILFIGDISGKPGRDAVKGLVKKFREENGVEFVIANVENAAGGFGITAQVLDELFFYGIDAATSGNHIWDKKEVLQIMTGENRLLRPANYPEGVPGKGSRVFLAGGKTPVGVLNLQGRIYMPQTDCPFKTAKAEILKLKKDTAVIIVDFHAEVTSEKNALAWYLDGEASAVIGTHTHVQTADEKVLPKGTAFISDAGMTGAHDSVIGIRKEIAIERFLLSMPVKFEVAENDVKLCGVLLDIDEKTGRANSIKRVCEAAL